MDWHEAGLIQQKDERAMYKSILVPLDGSKLAEAILPEIEKVASSMQGRILYWYTILTVGKAGTPEEGNPLHNFLSFPCSRLRMFCLCLITMQMAKIELRPTYREWYPVAAVQTGRVRRAVREPRET